MNIPYQLLGVGRNRVAFLLPSGKYVLKVPRNDAGVADNYHEARFGGTWNYAKCKLVNLCGISCLIMEYLDYEPIYEEYDLLPDWTMSVDCCQVGYNRKGKLLAYDFGNG
jgi:hypothetical protein